MTTIIKKYVGFTHPLSKDVRLGEKEYGVILQAWKTSNCPNGIHLWDEVWNTDNHYLYCDACGIEIHIEKVVIPDGKEDILK